MNDVTTSEIQVEMTEAREAVDLADTLKRLHNNADFKKVIVEGYFEKEAIRLVGLKSAASMHTPEAQAHIIRSIDGIGELQQHFNMIYIMGEQAYNALEESAEALQEMATEGGGS